MSLFIPIFESFLGEPRKINEETGQLSFDCPECSYENGLTDGDGKGNLEINYYKGVFKCWACQDTNNMHGPIEKLISRFGSKKNLEEWKLYKPDTEFNEHKEHKEVHLELPEGYKRLSECTDKDYKSKQALHYLRSRGITDEIIDKYDIGYTYKGEYFNRIIIPSYDSDMKLNYFVARWFAKEFNKLKYLNPHAEKQEIIFNEGRINWDSTIYIVEGTTDHIVTPNSIPLLGKYLSDNLLLLLCEKAQANVVVVLDDDAYLDAVNLYKRLNTCELHGRVKIVKCPNGYDPSKIFETLGNNGIIKLLKSAYYLDEKDLL